MATMPVSFLDWSKAGMVNQFQNLVSREPL